MFVTDSLFSLEFTVDKLTVTPGVVCRFPTVAFRFLDFPTVSLHFLDEVQRDRLRAKLTIDPEYTIPDQIKDYQNKSGYYEFSSGKSCLYRIPPDDLRSLLAQVPLYIIIADGFSATPTLVGSAILPLTEAMEEVYELLLKDGVSVPASSGVRSSLTVYNLMGHAIGQVIVGCRLISLGMALLTHLPESSVASHKHCEPGVYMPSLGDRSPHSPQAKLVAEKANISNALVDLETEESAQKYPIVHVDKQQQTTLLAEKDTQTGQKPEKKKQLVLQKQDEVDEGIELIIPDIYCPPPLYYNKSSIAQRTIFYQQSVDVSEASGSQASCATAPGESQFGKQLTETADVGPAADMKCGKEKITHKITAELAQTLTSAAKLPSDTYPLLSTLMSELLSIGTGQVEPIPKIASTPLKPPKAKRLQTPLMSPVVRPHSPAIRESNKTGLVPKARPSTPGTRPLSRQGSRKGPLVFGYTNTQKLRLSKTNPELLRRIEEEEAINKQKRELQRSIEQGHEHQKVTRLRVPRGRRQEGQRSFRSYTSQQQLDASTEMGRLTTGLAEVKRELAEQRAWRTPRQESSPDLRSQGVNIELGVTRILTPSMSKVLPTKHSSLTPRRSVSALSNRTSRDGADLSTLHELSFQSDSRRSLEIHIPTPVMDEGERHPLTDSSRESSQHSRGDQQPSARGPYKHQRANGSENMSPDIGEDYSLTMSHGGDNSSPMGAYRYSSDSFVSEED